MTQRRTTQARTTHAPADLFELVRTVGLTFPDVDATTRYDGSPVLKMGGAFMAGLAADGSAEPGTLVVRVDVDDREGLIADAPDIYYVTDYHERHPVVLVRLSRIDRDTLRDLLSMAWRATLPKAQKRRRVKSRSTRTRSPRAR